MQERRALLRVDNFDLAFRRLRISTNWQYKNFSRHLFDAFDLAPKANIKHLIADIRSNAYEPSSAKVVYFPKSSGVLRPVALLTVRDQIVYQSLVNVVTRRLEPTQRRLKYKRTFGAIYSGSSSQFFYRDWRYSYRAFNKASVAAFSSGEVYYSEFDLVSFYEIIDHHVLRGLLLKKGLSEEFLDLLFKCISKWTTSSTSELHHGIPQGPLSSALLAECLLFEFDQLPTPGVTYLRHIDDIRLLSRKPQPILRTLISLDIASKEYGLVPQAQKITKPKRAKTSEEIIKSIPSLGPTLMNAVRLSQTGLWKILKSSISYKDQSWTVVDATNSSSA
jgi:hypothetical protein